LLRSKQKICGGEEEGSPFLSSAMDRGFHRLSLDYLSNLLSFPLLWTNIWLYCSGQDLGRLIGSVYWKIKVRLCQSSC